MNYYNELDPYAAAWLLELIKQKLIPNGHVDTRSITDVSASDLHGYTQCHFFAGIGGWSRALEFAGWHEDRPVWTGSCPCQPFSHANRANGGGRGLSDERHLWPAFFRLIKEQEPPVIFGEQVASSIGKGWLDEAFGDMEKENYACGAVILPACAFDADHERKRLYWGAYAGGERWEGPEPIECISLTTPPPLSIVVNEALGVGSALDGDFSGLLQSNGVSLKLERDALKCCGNAIVPQVAAEFIKAFMSL